VSVNSFVYIRTWRGGRSSRICLFFHGNVWVGKRNTLLYEIDLIKVGFLFRNKRFILYIDVCPVDTKFWQRSYLNPLKPSGKHMNHQDLFWNFCKFPTQCMLFPMSLKITIIFALYYIHHSIFLTEVLPVLCAVRNKSVCAMSIYIRLQRASYMFHVLDLLSCFCSSL